MKEFLRGPLWTSPESKAIYGQAIVDAATAWNVLEVESVFTGLRSSALLHLSLESYAALQRRAVGAVQLVALAAQPLGSSGYTSRSSTTGSAGIRAALTTGDPSEWFKAWDESDDDRIGALLGFPKCCRDFFKALWRDASRLDTSVDQAAATPDGPPEANSLLRWFGVRLVPHLPCSFTCRETVDLGRRFAQLGVDLGLGGEVRWLRALLSAPMSFSTLHGTGVIKTPWFRFEFSSDVYPQERTFTRAAVQLEALPPSTGRLAERIPSSAEDNGFSSTDAMQSAHAVIMAVAGRLQGVSVVDLGCGDGALLGRLKRQGAGRVLGVEVRDDRAARGRQRHGVEILTDSIQAWAERMGAEVFDLGILMPGRLAEMADVDKARVLAVLRLRFRRLVVYSYDGRDELETLCEGNGLPLPGKVTRGAGNGVTAGMVTW